MKKYIFVIQNNNFLTPYIEKTLENNFKIIILKNIIDILKTSENDEPSLIILDESLESEYNNKIKNKYPAIVISDSKNENNFNKNIYYINKPFSFISLLTMINEIIENNDNKSGIICVDSLKIDIQNHIVSRSSKLITLTKKEYKLLLFLAKNKDKAVSRSELLEHVWGMQIDPFSNTVEAHVFSLRKKIDKGHKTKLIHTIPKFGYRVSINK